MKGFLRRLVESSKQRSNPRPVRITDDVAAPATRRHARAALLINLGTPERCDVPTIRSYLHEFLSDPSVIHLPTGLGWLNGPLARLIAFFRAPSSCKMYEHIWTDNGSPLKIITEEQAQGLEEALPRNWEVYHAMRYGRPSIPETLRAIEAAGVEELVVVPMYPQYSDPTTGTAMRLVYDYLKRSGSLLHVTTRTCWYDDHGYINAQSKLLQQYTKEHGLTPENSFLVFSTHGLPVSYVSRGDPYPDHVRRTAALVAKQLGWPADRMSLAYQSRFGPVKWLKPFTDELLSDLADAGEKRVLVCPISFTADCLETLEELDLRDRTILEDAGAQMFLCPALNTFEPFISALKHLVLRGPQSMAANGNTLRHSIDTENHVARPNVELDSLIMVGLSMSGRIDSRHGPSLSYVDVETLGGAKRSQCEVPDVLRSVCNPNQLSEAWIWNTCHRYELYGWAGANAPDRKHLADQLQRQLFQDGTGAAKNVNILFGADAWHHLARTAVGLNSSLPGERDILQQLQAAHRLAECAGAAGLATRQLLDEVLSIVDRVQSETAWGQFSADYAHISLGGVSQWSGIDFTNQRIVVIGGSTTSVGAMVTLREQFNVPGSNLTLLYRGHKNGGQLKLLRKAIGNGRRLRLHSYDEPAVLQSIADADIVVSGLDRNEPILDGHVLRSIRDWRARPLTIVDFNMFGSTTGLERIPGIHLYDARRLEDEAGHYADQLCASPQFARAVEAAESWLAKQFEIHALQGNHSAPVSTARTRVNYNAAHSTPNREAS